MKKRIFALALALCMMMAVMPNTFAAGILSSGNGTSVPASNSILSVGNGADSSTAPTGGGILSVGGTESQEEELSTSTARSSSTFNLMSVDEEGETVAPQAEERVDNSNIVTNKTVSGPDDNGAYTITLETFVTGQTTTTETHKAADMDIILILDTSREMVTETGNMETVTSYVEIGRTPREVYNYSNQGVYYKNTAGEYISVTVTRSGSSYNRTYTVSASGNTIETASGWDSFSNTYYYLTETEVDVGDGGDARLSALKTAAINFIDAIDPEGTTENDRRVALISYNSSSTVLTGELSNGVYADENDSIDAALRPVADEKDLLKAEINALKVNTSAAAYCETALHAAKLIFQNGDAIAPPVPTTRPRIVILLSAGVFGPSGTLESSSEGDGRTAMDMIWLSVILKTARGTTASLDFGSNFYGFTNRDANSFSRAYGSYAGCGATVYCVGLGMPNTEPTGAYTTTGYGTIPSRINEVMYRVSSHRPDGTHTSKNMYNPWESRIANSVHKNDDWEGTYPDALTRNVNKLDASYISYFLTADDTSELNGIFETISNSITTGGASIELNESTTVVDVVSDYFVLPEGVNPNSIEVYMADCTAVDTSGAETEYSWASRSQLWPADKDEYPNDDISVNVTLNSDDTVSVTGFDYSEYWVGKDSQTGVVHGKKLVIVFKVYVSDDFLGGEDIPTNGGGSHVVNGDIVFEEFIPPTVDIEINPGKVIPDWTEEVVINSQTIYLSNYADLTAMLSQKANSKLNGVNNGFVDTVFTVKQGSTLIGTYTVAAGETVNEGDWSWEIVNNYENGFAKALAACTDYTISCTIGGVAMNGTDTATVHVVTPDFVFDDAVMYLSNTPAYADVGYEEVWAGGCANCGEPDEDEKPTIVCQTNEYDPDDDTLTTCTTVTPYIKLIGDRTITDIEQEVFDLHVLIPTVSFKDATIHLGTILGSDDYNTKCYKNTDTAWTEHASQHDTVSDLTNIGTDIAATALTFTYDVGNTDYKSCYNVSVTGVTIGENTYDEFVAESPAFRIHVLQPVVTVALTDTTAYYGDIYTLGTGATGEIALTWSDDDQTAPWINPIDTAPYEAKDLSLAYAVTTLDNNEQLIVMPNFDVTVNATVMLDGEVFADSQPIFSTSCDLGCQTKTDGTYVVHPLTCTLTISNSGSNSIDENQSFIFNVSGNNEYYPVNINVVIDENGNKTIVGLPVGTYTVSADDGNWSWRYVTETKTCTVSADDPTEAVTIISERKIVKWFDAIAETVKNIFEGGSN